LANADETDVGEGRVGVTAKVGVDVGKAGGGEEVGVTWGGLEVEVNVGSFGVAVMVGAVVTTTSTGPPVGVDGSGWLAPVRHAASIIAASKLITVRNLISWYSY
jgi:acyl dehydratase